MKTKTMLALYAAATTALSAAVPEIRYTTAAPFDAGGKRIESAWKKADTCVRFVTVKTMDVAIDQSEAQLLFDDTNLYASLTGFFNDFSGRVLARGAAGLRARIQNGDTLICRAVSNKAIQP